MREKLIAAQLWDSNDPGNPSEDMSAAWHVLARIGAACRYSGLSQDGQREYLLLDPKTGGLLASGRGRSTPEALCQAALASRFRLQHRRNRTA